jgi:hypothetical protein
LLHLPLPLSLLPSFLSPLQGENNFLYTTSISDITVKGLGLIPISRSYKNDCTVLKKWGADSLTLSDCYGQFV